MAESSALLLMLEYRHLKGRRERRCYLTFESWIQQSRVYTCAGWIPARSVRSQGKAKGCSTDGEVARPSGGSPTRAYAYIQRDIYRIYPELLTLCQQLQVLRQAGMNWSGCLPVQF